MELSKIVGKQVYIRQLQNDDFENWCKANESKEFRVMCGESKDSKPPPTEKKKGKFNKMVRQESGLCFAIIRRKDEAYLGSCRLHKLNMCDKNARLAIGLLSDYFGKGYGTDAMKCLLKFGFNELSLHRVELRVLDFNKRGISAYKKCGFKKEGVLRENAYIDGKYYDDIIMSILESEFEK
ncbi:GNAT family N-acetyltransferase [Candidatus Peregrinibacteria bacterium]|jgi:RimJ/RimL family protein N-acetyltransferase|nr:GNAT family N-acetyltransferase [Candidatus Peregrinibacteria bacterium]